ENLYRGYPTDYSQQLDGYLPDNFPSPFPDDGGVDPKTGEFTSAGAGNRRVDDNEFHDVAMGANGAISGGVIDLVSPGTTLDPAAKYQSAITTGNSGGLADTTGAGIHGNVVLTGWPDRPIRIDGTVAVDGDLVIQGYVKGSGSLYVRGNVYMPADVMYADGKS